MASDTQHTSLRRLWWLEPAYLFAAVIGGTMLVAYAQDDAAYALYGTPKFVTLEHLALTAAAILVFALGQQMALGTGRVPENTSPAASQLVRTAFWLTTGLTLLGYAVWLLVGLKNGFSLGTIREFLVADDLELGDQVRTEMFATIKGVTTCTQFGIAALPLGLWLLFVHQVRAVVWPIALIIAFAAVRALFLSERLAFLELLVPAVIIILRLGVMGRRLDPLTRRSLQLAPLLGIMALVLAFGSFEYFRSWRHYRNQFDSFPAFTIWRVAGYYTTAHNNGAMALETQPPHPIPYATFRQLWNIPGLSSSAFGYEQITGIDPTRKHEEMLERYGTPELNNEGGLLQPALDFGLAGFLFFWFGAGFVGGRLYRHFLVGTLAGVTLFPLVFIAILETPRFLYLSNTRSFPALVALAIVLWLARRLPKTTVTPISRLETT